MAFFSRYGNPPTSVRGIGFVKINAHCTLVEGDVEHEHRLKGICFLKGDSVAVLVALHCEDGTVHSLLVEQPRYVHDLMSDRYRWGHVSIHVYCINVLICCLQFALGLLQSTHWSNIKF